MNALALRPYAGRWVALVRGQIAGVGLTAHEARAAAQAARPREVPGTVRVDERPLDLPPLIDEIRRCLPDASGLWLVGGAVRDALLNRRLHDFDFAVAGDGLAAARTVADRLQAACYPLDAERGVGRVIVAGDSGRFTLDFARLRGPDIAADLVGRDFTINALAVPLHEPAVLLDPSTGMTDLRDKSIRLCAPNSIADDPVRTVRAVRLAAQLGFRLTAEARAAVRAQAGALGSVSPERQRDEFIRCLGGPRPAAALRALDALGLLGPIAPELEPMRGLAQPPPHALDVWEHTLATVERLAEVLHILGPVHDVDAASDLTLGLISVRLGRHRLRLEPHLSQIVSAERPARWLLMLAALLHDAGKPRTRSVESDGRVRFVGHEAVGAEMASAWMRRLSFANDEIRRVAAITANHMRPRQLSSGGPVSRRSIYRFYRDTGEAGVDCVLLSLADFLAKFSGTPPPQDEWARHLDGCAQLLAAYFEHPAEQVAPPALINGNDLMDALGLQPGPRLGEILEAVREAQAAGEVSDRASALAMARQIETGRRAQARD